MAHLSSTMQDVAKREAEQAVSGAEASIPDMADPPFAAPDEPVVLYGPDMEDTPVPGVSDIVIYSLGTQWRAGRNQAPAFVVNVHDDGTLDLVVIFDAEDFLGLRHVPKATPNERGWMVRSQVDEAAKVRTELEAFKEQIGLALFGEVERPTESILELLDTLAQRVEVLEARMASVVTKVPTAVLGASMKAAARKKRR